MGAPVAFRLAHISDPHVWGLTSTPWLSLFNKRLTGWANLALSRGKLHADPVAEKALEALEKLGADFSVISGDLTNLALPQEFQALRGLLERRVALGPKRVGLVPGNHDVYTQEAADQKRFEHYLSDYCQSDVQAEAQPKANHPCGLFPWVRLVGPLAVIGIDTALPRPPFVSAGEVGQEQLATLAALLKHPEVASRRVVIVLHHPPYELRNPRKTWFSGLRDRAELLKLLALADRPMMVLHGHLHHRCKRQMPLVAENGSAAGELLVHGAASASLHRGDPEAMAGINLYEFGSDGELLGVKALVLQPLRGVFEARPWAEVAKIKSA